MNQTQVAALIAELNAMPAGLYSCDANGSACTSYVAQWKVVELVEKHTALAQQAQEGTDGMFISLCGRVILSGPRADVEHLVRMLPDVDAPSPQAPGRRKGPPGITLEPQGHEPPAAPVVSDEVTREQINALLNDDSQDSEEMHDFARAILALQPTKEAEKAP